LAINGKFGKVQSQFLSYLGKLLKIKDSIIFGVGDVMKDASHGHEAVP
jgi:hypothetical protein